MKIDKLGLLILGLLTAASGVLVLQLITGSPPVNNPNYMPITNKVLKKAAFIVAYRDYRDQEYFIPKEIFEKAGVSVVTASSQNGIAVGVDGGEAAVDLLLSALRGSDYDAIVFIGGPGAIKYLDVADSYRVAKEAIIGRKVLGAICVAPIILANGGILDGKKATVWSGPMNKTAIDLIRAGGATYVEAAVISDGLIVTGNGPDASEEFAKKIVEMIKKQ